MIIVADLLKSKNVHVGVDAGLLKVISMIHNNQKINLYCEDELYNNISKVIEDMPSNICHKSIFKNQKYKIKINFYINIILSVYHLFCILIKYNNSNDIIYILCLHPITNYVFSKLKNFFRDSKTYIVLHGEIEQLDKKSEINKFWRQHFYTSRMLRNDLINNKYLVFGDIIKVNLIKVSILKDKNIISIDHPYIYKSLKNITINKHDSIIISSIGLANHMKRSYLIFTLGKKLKAYIEEKKLELKIIGMVNKEFRSYINEFASYKGIGDLYLEQTELEQTIMSSDYLIYFYSNENYKLISSGALFDAIKYEKPIIALKNDFFEYYFKMGGNIGFLCNDLDEMAALIEKLFETDYNKLYNIQKNNIKLLKEKLDIVSISEKLKEQL